MARYRFSIDFGAFLGMRHISVALGDKTVQGIFIPTGINGIDVKVDNRPSGKGNQSGLRAFANFQQRNYNSAYLQVVRDRLVQQGEQPTPYNVPAMQVCYMLPEERRKKIREGIKKSLLKEHPEWASMEDVKGTELSNAISRMMPFQLGDSYLIEEQSGVGQSSTSAPVAQSVSGYTPVTDYTTPSTEEDLPF